MLKSLPILCVLFFSGEVLGREGEAEKKSGYRYILKNYFSKRQAINYDYSRSFALSGGLPVYRASGKKSFEPFSSLSLSFNQKVSELPDFGDFSLQVFVSSAQMEKQRAVLLELNPRISIPEIRTLFPFYLGLGAGLGFYPRHIVRQIPALSFNSQFFMGFRFLELYYNMGLFSELNLRIHYPFNESTFYLETLISLGLIFRI